MCQTCTRSCHFCLSSTALGIVRLVQMISQENVSRLYFTFLSHRAPADLHIPPWIQRDSCIFFSFFFLNITGNKAYCTKQPLNGNEASPLGS